ncbi:MAG: hypothetical protein H6Q99_1827 [Proteobacteria bacterium]|nr:hypothetical protein [Pseudomonadota bacterium]
MPDVLVDNDVVIKSISYGFTDEMLSLLQSHDLSPAILAVSHFMISNKMKRLKSFLLREVALAELSQILGLFNPIEPNEAELALAAEFEDAARTLNLELDSGESQLFAILLQRALRLMLTGDKRAIRAIEAIAGSKFDVPAVACLEQLIISLVGEIGVGNLRSIICSEKAVDKTLAICFRCSMPDFDPQPIMQGLASYASDVRRSAPRAVIASDGLFDLVP